MTDASYLCRMPFIFMLQEEYTSVQPQLYLVLRHSAPLFEEYREEWQTQRHAFNKVICVI